LDVRSSNNPKLSVIFFPPSMLNFWLKDSTKGKKVKCGIDNYDII